MAQVRATQVIDVQRAAVRAGDSAQHRQLIRLCANTGARLHLVGPLGFTLEAAQLRRAGLDYHDLARVQRHADLPSCVAALRPTRLFVIETGAAHALSEARSRPGDSLLFGRETARPAGVVRAAGSTCPIVPRQLPMQPSNRSLNLSNAVAVVVYEAWRQNGFAGADGAPVFELRLRPAAHQLAHHLARIRAVEQDAADAFADRQVRAAARRATARSTRAA